MNRMELYRRIVGGRSNNMDDVCAALWTDAEILKAVTQMDDESITGLAMLGTRDATDMAFGAAPYPECSKASPYTVHSLLLIMSAIDEGSQRTDQRTADAKDALILSLWKLANKGRPELDINYASHLVASVAYDAAALRTILESGFPEQLYPDAPQEIDRLYTKFLMELLAGNLEPDARDLLLFNSPRGTPASVALPPCACCDGKTPCISMDTEESA